ncbi:MAG: chorismate synthase [Deltaproteobacteria bacterium RBG_13_52_11b]|nr:MAG: chorismate synthase [Deltaproteobacteria bacterium RBG_13_52_11b]
MGGNSFGTLFRITTWGESHGPALGVVIDGCPPGITLSSEDIQKDLDRRRPGVGTGSSPRQERDKVEVLSGVFEGKTTGTPISLLVKNEDVDSRVYEEWREVFRPGHADFTYQMKYGMRDHRGGGRASARETVGRVAAGAVAKKILKNEKVKVTNYTLELGGIRAQRMDEEEIEKNYLRCPDREAAAAMEKRVQEVKNQGDSVGGIIEIRVQDCPAGLGEPVFDKLEADLAKGLMSIGAVRGVEIGAGFGVARMTGSECNDPMGPNGFKKNDAGGILGGISNGADIVLRVAVKPIPSIHLEQATVNHSHQPVSIRIEGRHDVSAIPRINQVCEAMVAIVLADHLLRQKAIGGR